MLQFDIVFTAMWQHYAPGDYNPLIEWAFLISPTVTMIILLASTVILMCMIRHSKWKHMDTILAIIIGIQAIVITYELKLMWAVLG